MARGAISKLAPDQRRELLDGLNYLNTAEIRAFCKRHSIPFTIVIEAKDGSRRRTKDDDRKGIVLERVRHFLQTGEILEETCFRAAVVRLDPLPEALAADDKLFYGQYDKANHAMIALLRDLTAGRFRNGAIARIVAREFWSSGKAPTFREYAAAWIQAVNEHTKPNPEWAFLSDRANQTAGPDWKSLRARKAARLIQMLNRITARP